MNLLTILACVASLACCWLVMVRAKGATPEISGKCGVGSTIEIIDDSPRMYRMGPNGWEQVPWKFSWPDFKE